MERVSGFLSVEQGGSQPGGLKSRDNPCPTAIGSLSGWFSKSKLKLEAKERARSPGFGLVHGEEVKLAT